jgi:transcriptional regulator with XRE-family HTH domain
MSKRNPFSTERVILRNLLIDNRKNKNITQSELAQILNKPQSFVSKYENGDRSLDLIELYDICNALNIDIIFFLGEFKLLVDKFHKANLK